MCKALSELMNDEKEKGRSEGLECGERNTYKSLISMLLAKGKSVLEIARDLDKSEDFVLELMKQV